MFTIDWVSVTIGYMVGIMMYHSIAFIIIPKDKAD